MKRRALPLNLPHDLIQQPPSMMPGITDPARQTPQPEFERGSKGIRKASQHQTLAACEATTASQIDLPPNEITASTSGKSRQTEASFAGASNCDMRVRDDHA